MTPQQIFVIALLVGILILFAWGRWRYDLVAIAAMLAVVLTGLVPADRALQSFGHPAVVTVAAVLIISRALRNSGIVDLIAGHLNRFTASTTGHISTLTGVVMLASAFMNNVGALALMLPVTLSTAAKRKRSPSLLLMPLAFGSLLGGLITLIGTPPNVIIATFREDFAGEPFSMFDFAPVGGAVALAGVAFVALFGWRLIPQRQTAGSAQQQFEIGEYIMEVRAVKGSKLLGKKLRDVEQLTNEEVVPVGVVRGKDSFMHPAPWRLIREGDLLIVKADPTSLKSLIEDHGMELVASRASALKDVKMEDLRLVEATIPPGSVLEFRNTAFLRRRTGHALSLIAIARQGRPIRTRLRRQTFQAGDVLLLQGDADSVYDHLNNLGLLPLAERDLSLVQPRRVGVALLVFAVAIAAATSGLVSTSIAFIAAIGAYVLLDILPTRDLYRDIDWPVIVLLAAMIPVGQALENTGATGVIADAIVSLTGGLPAVLVLTLVMLVTLGLTNVINNAAAALVMAPIAVAIADHLQVHSDPFLMAVAVGASSAFLTPIGHQSNTLVMGPGGYHFSDFWHLGLPLTVLIVVVSVPLIALVWPL